MSGLKDYVEYETAVDLVGANVAHQVWDDYLSGGSMHIRDNTFREAATIATIYGVDDQYVREALYASWRKRFDALKAEHIAAHS